MKLILITVLIMITSALVIGSAVETRVKRNRTLMNAFNKYRSSNQQRQPQRSFISDPHNSSGGFRNPSSAGFRGRRSLLPLIRRPAN